MSSDIEFTPHFVPALPCIPCQASWGGKGSAYASSARNWRLQTVPCPSNAEFAGILSSCCTKSKEKTTNPTVIEKRKLGQPTETIKTSPRKTNHDTFESVQNILTKFLLQKFAFCILHAGLTGMQWQFLFQFRNCSFAIHRRKFTPKHWLVNHSFRGPTVQLFWSDNEKT